MVRPVLIQIDLDDNSGPSLKVLEGNLDDVAQAADRASGGPQSPDRGVGGLTKSLGGLGAVLGGAAVGGALVSFGASVIARAGELRDLSAISNLSAEGLQQWEAAARAGGGSAEDAADAARELQLRLAEAASLGTGPAVDALDQLGLSIEDIIDLPIEDKLELVRDRLSEVEDESQRLFLAEELLGGSAERLNSALATTAEQFAAVDVAEEAAIRRTAELQDKWDTIWTSLQNRGIELLVRTSEAFNLIEEAGDPVEARIEAVSGELDRLVARLEEVDGAPRLSTLWESASAEGRFLRERIAELRDELGLLTGDIDGLGAGLVYGAELLDRNTAAANRLATAYAAVGQALAEAGGTADNVYGQRPGQQFGSAPPGLFTLADIDAVVNGAPQDAITAGLARTFNLPSPSTSSRSGGIGGAGVERYTGPRNVLQLLTESLGGTDIFGRPELADNARDALRAVEAFDDLVRYQLDGNETLEELESLLDTGLRALADGLVAVQRQEAESRAQATADAEKIVQAQRDAADTLFREALVGELRAIFAPLVAPLETSAFVRATVPAGYTQRQLADIYEAARAGAEQATSPFTGAGV